MNAEMIVTVRRNFARALLAVVLAGPVWAQSNYATPYEFTTLAGGAPGSADDTGTAAQFQNPLGVAVDAAGVVYVADVENHIIRKITAGGVVTTFAGVAGQNGSADGIGSAARFSYPFAVATDGSGNVYVADAGNNTIRKISPGGEVTTLAGTAGPGGLVDGTGSAARFYYPEGLAVDSAGNVYVADYSAIRKVSPDGVVTTLAGLPSAGPFDSWAVLSGFGIGSTDGQGGQARFNQASAVAVDGAGNVYVADQSNHTIRKITPDGTVSTFAGTAGVPGSTDGPRDTALFDSPAGVALDAAGNLYVSDSRNFTIRRISPAGVVTTMAGLAGTLGAVDGIGVSARFGVTGRLALDASGNVYVADSSNNTIRKGSPAFVITTQPTSQTVAVGQNAILSVAAFGEPAPSCRWQYSNDGGTTWHDLADSATYTGTTTFTLTVNMADYGGAQLRAVLTNPSGTVTSNPVGVATLPPIPKTPGLLWGPGTLVAGLGYQTTPTPVATGVASVTTGYSHSLYLKTDGTLWAMGNNAYGQLGDGTTVDRSTPVLVATNVVKASAGGFFSAFIKSDGTLWTMGNNGLGNLGDGTFTDRSTPVPVAANVASVATAHGVCYFVKTDGSLWVAGNDGYGQLGDGGNDLRCDPVQIATNVASVAVSEQHCLYVTTDGNLWATGLNTSGELGDGTTTNRNTPVEVASGVAAVTTSQLGDEPCSLFLKTDGSLWAMGGNRNGQLGDGTTVNRSTPVQIATGVVKVAGGSGYNLFIKADASLWAMGANDYGQLGDGTTVNRSSPVRVASGVVDVTARANSTLFLKADGSLWAMGDNRYGQLGDGDAFNCSVPAPVAGSVTTIVASNTVDLFITADGTLWTAGSDAYGQLGDGVVLPDRTLLASGVVAAELGSTTSLYAKGDGKLWSLPGGQIPGVSGVTDVIVSDYDFQRLYLKSDGSLWRLAPDNTSSRVADGVVSAGAGLHYVVYLTSDGTLWGQGGGDGAILFGDGLAPVQVATGVVALSAAGWHVLFVKNDQTLWGMGTVWNGWGDQYAYDEFVATPVQLETGVIGAVANPGHNLYLKNDGTLWSRGSGWAWYTGPAVLVDTDVVRAASIGYTHSMYIKGDGTLWDRTGILDPLGAAVLVAPGVESVMAGTDSDDIFIQQPGAGTKPAVAAQAPSAAVVWGETRLQALATGTGPFSYQWYKDGVALPGGRAAQLPIANAGPGDAGTYTVVVTNAAGSSTSNGALLRLQPAGSDFNLDGKPDLLWENTATGERYLWMMNGNAFAASWFLGVIDESWQIAGSGDFNQDGKPDILWQNTITGERVIWLMSGTNLIEGVYFAVVPPEWSIAGAADFNGDSKPDILWQNAVTGERVIWLMDGTAFLGSIQLGVIPTGWSIAGAADFNGDGQPDILWQNPTTGERVVWLMNGAVLQSGVYLSAVSIDWSIAGTGDFNGDGRADIIWQNKITGERALWLMDGTVYSSGVSLGAIPLQWSIRN